MFTTAKGHCEGWGSFNLALIELQLYFPEIFLQLLTLSDRPHKCEELTGLTAVRLNFKPVDTSLTTRTQ